MPEDKKMIDLNPKAFNELVKNKKLEIIDKGEITVENQRDYEMVMKYIEALQEGNETYKPAGLKIKKRDLNKRV